MFGFDGSHMIAAAALLALGSAAHAETLSCGELSLLPIRTEIEAGARLGRKKIGMICAPGGSWYWKDVGAPRDELEVGLRPAFEDAGVAVSKASDGFGDAAVPSDRRLRGRVTEFSVDACIPWKAASGLIGGKKIKGDGHIRVIWEIYSASQRQVVWSKDVRSDFRVSQAADMSALFAEAVLENARSVAVSLADSCPAHQDS